MNILQFFFLALFGKLVFSFNCPDITNQTKCTTLGSDCEWVDSECTGNYVPTGCTGCKYVDTYSTAGSPSGSLSNPYLTLTAAINSANTAASVSTIIILNYKEATDVILTASAMLSGQFTIKPLFEDEMYKLDISQIANPLLLFTLSKNFYIKGAIIEYTIPNGGATFVVNNNVHAIFENVNWQNCDTNTGWAIRVQSAAATNAKITYLGGLFINSVVKFSIAAGTHEWKDIKVINPKLVSPMFALSGIHNIENLTVMDSNNIFNIFLLNNNVRVTMKDALFESLSNFLFNYGSSNYRFLSVENATFRDLMSDSMSLFLGNGVATTDKITENIIKNCTFENITVAHSLFYFTNGPQIIFDSVSMNNLRKIESIAPADLLLEVQWPGGICALTSTDVSLTVKSSNFTNIYGHCFGTQLTAITVEDSIFDNSDLDETPITLTATTVNSLTKNSGTSWVNIEDLAQTDTLGYQAIFRRNTFKTNKRVSLYGGAIRFNGVNFEQLYLEDNQFIGLTAGYGGAIYTENVLAAFNLSGNIFEENKAFEGGAIYKGSKEIFSKIFIPSMYIEGDQFIRNKAVRNGGGMFLDWESLYIQNGIFAYNQATNGGGIYFVFLDSNNNINDGKLIGTSFTHNHATNAGGAMKLFFKYPELNEDSTSPTYFFNNTDKKNTTGISEGQPAYFMFSFYNVLVEKTFSELDDLSQWVKNSTRTSLDFQINTSEPNPRIISHKSGHEVDYIIGIEVYDTEGNIADYINDERIIVTVVNTSNSLSNFSAYAIASPIYLALEEGAAYFKTTLKLVGEPQSQVRVNFYGVESSSTMLKALGLVLDFDLQFSFRDCEIGDIYDNLTKTCDTCPSGTYSLADPYGQAICQQCDFSQQLCLGGAKISPQPGFWRYDVNLPVVIACPEPSACQGGLVEERFYPQGRCEYPYEGNLCNMCAINHAKFGSDETCVDCSKDSLYYVKFLGFFALRVAAVAYSIKVNLNKVSGNKKKKNEKEGEVEKKNKLNTEDFQSNLMKIVVNFLQVSSIIFLYRFDWPDFILRIVDITNKVIPTNSEGFSVDCLVALASQDTQNIYFIKFVVTLLEPLGLWLGLMGVYILYLRYRKLKLKGNPEVKKNIVVLFVITGFIVQPNLIQATLELFKCTNLRTPEDPAYFMTKSPNVECWTPKHILWSIGVALPFFLLWGVVLPIILLKKLMARAKFLNNPEVYSKYAFVYEGLKTQRYYWEFVTLVRKTVIIFIFVFLNVISVQAQAFATFLVITFFTSLHVKFRPYSDSRLNRLELFSLITLGVMAYCGMFFLSGGSNEAITIMLILVSLCFNIAFYCFVGYLFIQTYRERTQKVIRKTKSTIRKGLEKARSRSQKSSNSNSVSQSENEKSSRSVAVKDLEEIIEGINLDSPSKKEDDIRKNSESLPSDIPSESEDSPGNDQKNYLGLGDSVNQSSIVRNFGIKQLSFLHQNSFNQNSHISNSINNSSFNLLSPAINSAQSTNRRPHNLSLNIENNLLRPVQALVELSSDRKQADYLDSPGVLKNLGASYEDSPRGGLPKLNKQISYKDDSLILKIPNSPSESRILKDVEQIDNKD